MRYCFVGLVRGAMSAYPAGLARAIASRDLDAHFTFIYNDKKALDGIAFPLGSEFVHWGGPRASVVRALVRNARPDLVITTAQRIPDSAFVSAARQAGIPTAMFQHGLYLAFMRREAGFFLQKIAKTVRYMRYAMAVADIHQASRAKYVKEFAAVYVRGKPYGAADVDHDALSVDRVLLNGEYWRQFHTTMYHYPHDRQEVVGYPDYDQLGAVQASQMIDGTCYVAQTLVEDGRLSPRLFREFLEILRETLGAGRLVVKLHPKSKIELYEPLAGCPNVTFTRDALPLARRYVGHYSTYLALIPFLSGNLFLWEFEGHKAPECLAGAASTIGSNAESLGEFLRDEGRSEPDGDRQAAFQHYFWRNPAGSAYDLAADRLIHLASSSSKSALNGSHDKPALRQQSHALKAGGSGVPRGRIATETVNARKERVNDS